MKKLTSKNTLYLTASIGLMFIMSGCASNNCSPSPFGQFFKDQPVRSSLRSLFTRGDACNTCNPPVGQPTCGTSVAPACNTCGNAPQLGQPVYGNSAGNGVSLYSEPVLNAPQQYSGSYMPHQPIMGDKIQPSPVPGNAIETIEPGAIPPQF